MDSRIYVRLFTYYFFKHFIVFLGFLYADHHFRKPFVEFSLDDFTRITLVVIIIGTIISSSSQSFGEFQPLSKRTRFLIGSMGGLAAVLSAGYLISAYY